MPEKLHLFLNDDFQIQHRLNNNAYSGDHQLRFTAFNGSTSYSCKGAISKINDTQWHHVVVEGDGVNITFYVDGVQDGTPGNVGFYTSGDATWPAVVGGTNNGAGSMVIPMHGAIDELHIFNRALSQQEILSLMQREDVEKNAGNLTSNHKYRFGYQGQFAEKDDETGWDHFELREYDPVIGRMLTPDPYGQFWSPYIGMGNDPVNGTDPDGGCVGGDCPPTVLDEVVVTAPKWTAADEAEYQKNLPPPSFMNNFDSGMAKWLEDHNSFGRWLEENMWDHKAGLDFYATGDNGKGPVVITNSGHVDGSMTDPGDLPVFGGKKPNFKMGHVPTPKTQVTIMKEAVEHAKDVHDGIDKVNKVGEKTKLYKSPTVQEVIDSTVIVQFPARTYTAQEYHPGPNSTEVIKRDTIWNK